MNKLVQMEKIRCGMAARGREVLAVTFPTVGPLTTPQWHSISALSKGSVPASELADKAGIQGPSLSRIIPDLKSLGLIFTEKSSKDGRILDVDLTPKGKRLHKKLHERFNEAVEPTESEKEQLKELVGEYAAN